MPTFTIAVGLSARVAALLGEYAVHNDATGSGRDWFALKVKELTREFARVEYSRQQAEGPQDPVPDELSAEVA